MEESKRGSRKARAARIEERRKKIAANLLAGLNYRDMAEALGVTIATVSRDVKILFDRRQREQVKTIDDHIMLDLRRIDRAVNSIWPKVLDGNPKAIEVFLKLLERRAKLLGEDKPAKFAPTDTQGRDWSVVGTTKIERP